ncbi:hypothetical protein H4R18_000181 [Coemansia javaensis]|uniref:J domain-containing protein n=1 Tax=Coemansia javaensis TaxID=2761396 RepID=A0A9W8LM30_9FUNG|nr:hypothetical protein H4R18_000181 [Coemansia javaensis]
MAGGSEVTNILGWMLLPQFAARFLLAAVHRVLRVVAPGAVPQAGSEGYARHQRVSYVVVVAGYLAYTLWATEQGLGDNFYHTLGVRPDTFSAEQLRRNFRRLSLAHHPDKNPDGEQQFIGIRHAYEVLSDPVTRFAYDHGGAGAVLCQSCKTVGDYMVAAIPKRLVVYLGYLLVCVAMQVFRVAQYGTFWRYLAIGAFGALELSMAVRTTEPLFVRGLLWLAPHRTSFEMAQIVQHAMSCFFIAVNQIGPQLIPQERSANPLALAKELLAKTRVTAAEVQGRATRLASFYRDTVLQRNMVEAFERELTLGMTLGTSPAFHSEFNDRLQAVRDRKGL